MSKAVGVPTSTTSLSLWGGDLDYKFNPVIELEPGDRAALVAMSNSHGYRVFHKIMRKTVDNFVLAMVNADPSDRESVLAKHIMAKTASQLYQGMTDAVNEEVMQYIHSPRTTDTPADTTEGILDLDDLPERLKDVPNFLGDVDDIIE